MNRLINVTMASSIAPTSVRWLVPGLIPLGKLTVVAGAPGLGKSLWTTLLAAEVSTGRTTGDLAGHAGAALIASAEDDPSDTIAPRLIAADADLNAVSLMDARVTAENGNQVEHRRAARRRPHDRKGRSRDRRPARGHRPRRRVPRR